MKITDLLKKESINLNVKSSLEAINAQKLLLKYSHYYSANEHSRLDQTVIDCFMNNSVGPKETLERERGGEVKRFKN